MRVLKGSGGMLRKPFSWEDGAALAQVTTKVGQSLAMEGIKGQVGRAISHLILCWSPM